MCCGSTQQTSSSSSTSNAGPQATSAINRANTVSQTPYSPYNGTMVAGFNPQQQQAFNQVNASQGIGTPYINQAAQYAQQGAAPITAQNITDTLNSTGLNQQVADLQKVFNQQNATANSTVTGNAAAQHALGGDRVGVAQALTQQALAGPQNAALSALFGNAYGQAAGIAQGNQQAAANAAYTYGNLGQEAQNQSTTDIQNLLTTGGLQQQNQQAQNNWDYQNNYLNPQAWPYQNAQWYAGILSSLGGLTGSTTTQSQAAPSMFSQLLGAGSALGGAWLMSDANVKDNISDPIGTLNDGTPVRSFNYKGNPTTQIGVIAQEAAHTNPTAVAHDPGTGLMMVDYNRVGRPQGLGEGFAAGGSVDPDLARMTSNLGHAVESVKRALPQPQGYADGGTIMLPTQLSPAPINYAAPAGSIVPQASIAPAQMMPTPQMAPQAQQLLYAAGVNSLAQGLGHYLGSSPRPIYSEPGTAVNGGWSTTVTPSTGGLGGWLSSWFADGGTVHDEPDIPHMAAGGGAYLRKPAFEAPIQLVSGLEDANPNQAPESGTGGGLMAAGTGLAAHIPTGPNVGPDATTPFSNVVGQDREVGSAPLPPTATAYAPPPMTTGSTEPEVLPWQQQQAQPQTADPAATPEKSWYEFGGSPQLGAALLQGGGAMMAGQSPFAGVNIGQGIVSGAGAYVQQQAIARQAQQLQIAAQKQAEIERHNQAIEQLQATNQPKVGTDMYGQRYWLSGPKAGQTINGSGSEGMFSAMENGELPTGEEMMKRLPPQIRAQVKAIGEYDAPVPTGIKGQAISDLVHQVYPDYDQSQYPVAQAVKKEFSQAGATGKSFYSVNMSLRHLDDLWEAYSHLNNYETLPGVMNWAHSEYSGATDPDYRYWLGKFEQAKKGISTELDKAMKGSGAPDVTGVEDIKKGFSPTSAPTSMRGTIEGAVGLLKGKLDGANRAYLQGTGGKTDMVDKWLDPDAKEIFEKFTNPEWGTEAALGRPATVGGGRTHETGGKAERPMTAEQLRALPDGPVTLGGKNYIKRGNELVPQ